MEEGERKQGESGGRIQRRLHSRSARAELRTTRAGARRGFETRSSCSHLSASAKRRGRGGGSSRARRRGGGSACARQGARVTVRGCAREAVLRPKQQPQATREEQPTREQSWQAQAKAGVVKIGSIPCVDIKSKIRALAVHAGNRYAVRFEVARLLPGFQCSATASAPPEWRTRKNRVSIWLIFWRSPR